MQVFGPFEACTNGVCIGVDGGFAHFGTCTPSTHGTCIETVSGLQNSIVMCAKGSPQKWAQDCPVCYRNVFAVIVQTLISIDIFWVLQGPGRP